MYFKRRRYLCSLSGIGIFSYKRPMGYLMRYFLLRYLMYLPPGVLSLYVLL